MNPDELKEAAMQIKDCFKKARKRAEDKQMLKSESTPHTQPVEVSISKKGLSVAMDNPHYDLMDCEYVIVTWEELCMSDKRWNGKVQAGETADDI